MHTNIAVHVEDLTMAYATAPVIWDIDLDIVEHSITAIVGPNGAGKSPLIKGILNLVKPLSGSVNIFNMPYQKVKKDVAYIPQSGSVNWNFPTNVLDVVLMGRYVHRRLFHGYTKEDKDLALGALKAVKMQDFQNRHIAQLSGGQKQRVFLARAIAQNARIYFMDEPLQGVDSKTEKIIMDILHRFQREGKTIVVVHHDLSTLQKYFTHGVLINKRLIASGTVEEAFSKENLALAYGG